MIPKPTRAIDNWFSYYMDGNDITADTPSKKRAPNKGDIVLIGMWVGEVISTEVIKNNNSRLYRSFIKVQGKLPGKNFFDIYKENYKGGTVKGAKLNITDEYWKTVTLEPW